MTYNPLVGVVRADQIGSDACLSVRCLASVSVCCLATMPVTRGGPAGGSIETIFARLCCSSELLRRLYITLLARCALLAPERRKPCAVPA